MSGANAISGIVILGAIILIRTTESDNYITLILASVALFVGSINVFGGFFVTNRMLEMFNKKKKVNGKSFISSICFFISLGTEASKRSSFCK